MIREIIFRGKYLETGEWLYGYYRCENKNTHIITSDTNCNLYSNYNKVIAETVGQYTGLKDKNAAKIFEGDIVNLVSNQINAPDNKYLVKFEKGIFGINFANINHFATLYGLLDRIEIIGNIYDNPELLKEGE